MVAAIPLLAWLTFRAAIAWWTYPPTIDRLPAAGTFIEDRAGQPLAAFVTDDGQWRLPLTKDQISPHLLAAIVAVEDARFHSHAGVDWASAAGSLWADVRHLGIRRGGSTLTMQLHRLRDPQPRTWLNKLEQAVRAEQIERTQSKEATLVEYLNRAPFGGNLVGAGAASWRYFGRPCRDLSLAQAALLAGLPQSPNRLRPDRHPAAAKARRDHVLDRMLATGVISRDQYQQAIAEPLDAACRPLPQDRDIGLMPTLQTFARERPSQAIRSTLDLAAQEQAYRATIDRLTTLAPAGVTAAAVVVADTPTGECLAAVSVGTSATDVDFTRSARSTGSTLKPLIYAAAFDAGICTADTPLDDSPSAWPGYVPSNYDGAFHGPMPAADALAESRNIPALLVLQKVGTSRATAAMASFGLRTLAAAHRNYGLSLAIGGAEATPCELAEAYATLARGGLWKPLTFTRDDARPTSRAMRAEPCWQVMRALSDADRTRDVSPEAAGRHVAWKTGTSSGHRDAWCAAVTPRRTVVVWLGNPGGEGSASLIGAEAAAPLALQLIAALDPGGDGWPGETTLVRTKPRPFISPAAARPRLVIASPERDQCFLLLPELRPDQQRVKLEASAAGESLWWFVDDAPVGRGRLTWWSPTTGAHRIRVVDADGRAANTQIDVR